MNLADLKKIYFVGIGGIGMSALARYFMHIGIEVHGYDRTETTLTQTLAAEGMHIHYTDDISFIPENVDLVIFTPAVPKEHKELNWFLDNNYPVIKRSEALGIISRGMKCLAVSGTHGKTSTSSLATHILRTGGVDATAFLGGISLSLGSNFVQGTSEWVVVEADEYDRSFLRLSPDIAIVLSIDPDHLDIYGDAAQFHEGFELFANKVKDNGKIFKKSTLELEGKEMILRGGQIDTFGLGAGTYRAENIRVEDGFFVFDLISPIENVPNIKMAMPGQHNIENATAAIAAAQQIGVKADAIREALASFKGIRRRFETIVRTEKSVFIDDYAHHPTELTAAISAARQLHPNRKLTGIFQPHLFTRTRDFQEGFAEALDLLDECILMDIYPARELPIAGVTSQILFDKMKNPHKTLVNKANLMEILRGYDIDVLMTLGAGDIDTFVEPIKKWLSA